MRNLVQMKIVARPLPSNPAEGKALENIQESRHQRRRLDVYWLGTESQNGNSGLRKIARRMNAERGTTR